jgi:hypothetical protein
MAYEKVLEMGSGNSSFPFYWPWDIVLRILIEYSSFKGFLPPTN